MGKEGEIMSIREGYYSAQICENGHPISKFVENESDKLCSHCPECGAITQLTCKHCNSKIHGFHPTDFYIYVVPKYCYNCGNPYPWIENAIETAKQIIELDETLNQTEKDDFKSTLPDLISETPKTPLAGIKLKKYFKKLGEASKPAIRQFIIDWTVTYVKKLSEP
jgi:hypothetical protein